jgi:hypothetical protein
LTFQSDTIQEKEEKKENTMKQKEKIPKGNHGLVSEIR